MSRLIPAAIAGIVALVVGFVVGRFTQRPIERPASLYVADVAFVDAVTGAPVNVSLGVPEEFLGSWVVSESGSTRIPGTGNGPFRAELETGRCRMAWIGIPETEFPFEFTADGYEPITLPPEFAEEVQHQQTIAGIVGSSVVRMKRMGQPNREKSATESARE